MKFTIYRVTLATILVTITIAVWLSLNISNKMKQEILREYPKGGEDNLVNISLENPAFLKSCFESLKCHHVKRAIIVNEAEMILYCPIPKVASTSIKLALVREVMQIEGGYDVHSPVEMLKAGFAKIHQFKRHHRTLKLDEMEKLIVVRHPFERLLSAYLDKFKVRNKWTKHFQHKYGKFITSKYRKNDFSSGHDVTFREFLEFLTDDDVSCKFKLNPHWSPYWILCNACSIKYNHVVKMENLNDGLNKFWLKTFGKGLNDSKWTWEHKGYYDTNKLMMKYFNQLHPSLIVKLFQLYQLDFIIFGYNAI